MMSIITIGNKSFDIPNQGQNPAWGEELHDAIVELAAVSNLFYKQGDIVEKKFTILNTSGAKNITDFVFNYVVTASFSADYHIDRSITKTLASFTSSGVGDVVEVTCVEDHNLTNDDRIQISGSSAIVGSNLTVTVISPKVFSIVKAGVTGASTSDTFILNLVESGTILGNHSSQGWIMNQKSLGNSLISIDISDTGQVTYTPVVLEGISHTGVIHFKANILTNN
jgi:hypothetical protein